LVTVSAPGRNVGVLNANGVVIRDDGTSFSAPFVTGLAGLLLSFDPTLSIPSVRSSILQGAINGGRRARTVPIVDGYQTLKAAAARPGAPLCGSRVWASGTGVYAQRDTTSTVGDLLFNLGDTASWINVFHGGHRIEVFDRGFFTHAFRYVSSGNWQATTDTAITLPGGTFSSLLWYSHDRDSVADITTLNGNGSVTFDVGVRAGTSPRQSLRTFQIALATSGTTCTHRSPAWTDTTTTPHTFHPEVCWNSIPSGAVETINWAAAFGLTGGQILVSVSKVLHTTTSISGESLCPGADPNSIAPDQCRSASFLASTESTYVWSVPTNGTVQQLLWPFPKYTYWLAGSEDGKQIVTGEGQYQQTSRLNLNQTTTGDPVTYSGCGVGYRRASTGAAAIPLITTQAVCLESQGQGTIAPAPRRQP
jgi:Subtilase family